MSIQLVQLSVCQNYSARPPEQSHGVDDDKLMSMTVIELKKYLGDHGVPREEYRSVFNKDMLRAKIQACVPIINIGHCLCRVDVPSACLDYKTQLLVGICGNPLLLSADSAVKAL